MCKTQKQRGGVVLGIGFVMALVGIGYYVNVGAQVDEAVEVFDENLYIGGEHQGSVTIQSSDIPEEADAFQGFSQIMDIWYDDSSITDDVECQSFYDACTVTNAGGTVSSVSSYCDSEWAIERDGLKRKIGHFFLYDDDFPCTITCDYDDGFYVSVAGGWSDGAENIGQAVGSFLLAWLLFALSGIFMCIACCCFGGCCGKDAAGAYPDDVVLPVTK